MLLYVKEILLLKMGVVMVMVETRVLLLMMKIMLVMIKLIPRKVK